MRLGIRWMLGDAWSMSARERPLDQRRHRESGGRRFIIMQPDIMQPDPGFEHGFRCGEKPVTADVGRQSESRAVHRSQATGVGTAISRLVYRIVERGA
jgi:hypothetical protein